MARAWQHAVRYGHLIKLSVTPVPTLCSEAAVQLNHLRARETGFTGLRASVPRRVSNPLTRKKFLIFLRTFIEDTRECLVGPNHYRISLL
jgi:hypothetical protein